MRISEKFQSILRGSTLPVQQLEKSAEKNHSTVIPSARAHYYFEEGSSVQSQWKLSASKAVANFIGRFSYINSGGFVRSRVMIGRYCSIGQRVSLAAGTHPIFQVSTCPALAKAANPYSQNEKERIGFKNEKNLTIIENDVWIGDGVVIMPGVTIGTGSVVAANSVVIHDVAPYSIVGGLPAKHIRFRFPKELCDGLLKSEWWEASPSYLLAAPTDNIFKFVDHVSTNRFDLHNFETYRI